MLFGVIVGSLINFFVGSFIPSSDMKRAKGIVGYSVDVFAENFWPNFRDNHSFMTTFAIFFPACTGIMAGANISGDLKVTDRIFKNFVTTGYRKQPVKFFSQ